jgi:nucleotide-binding universal stress UspA family protein
MKILVPVDGSQESLRAVALAIRFATLLPGSSVVLVNVQNTITIGAADAGILIPLENELDEELRLAADLLQEPLRSCKEAGVSASIHPASGPIADSIIRIAREEGADHIFMGTRGMGTLRGMLLGSISTQVLQLADVPVTLVK